MPAAASRSPRSFSPSTLVAMALIFWALFAGGGGWWLVRLAYQRFVEQEMLNSAEQLAALLNQDAGSSPAPANARPINLAEALLWNPHLAYGMVWAEDGAVLRHTRGELVGTYLDVNKWPPLEGGAAQRFSHLTPGNGASANSPGEVLDLTVALPVSAAGGVPPARPQYLSLAYPRAWIDEQFWPFAQWPLVYVLGFILLGAIILTLIILLTIRRLERSRREIEHTARARTSLLTERGMLASVLAHEVRSPLTALRFNLHSLRTLLLAGPAATGTGEDAEDRRLSLTDRCDREIRRLDGMLNDFLLHTQVLSPPEPAPLNAVIREAVEFLMPSFEQRHIRVSLHLDERDPHVNIHPDELRQVLLNLSANAQDAMSKGGLLAISTLAPPPAEAPGTPGPAANMITLLFRDSGAGIPEELRERIFEPFFSTKPNGSGLGLTLVRRVVSGAGGSLFVESSATEGTTFRILLPPPTTSDTGRGYAHQHGSAG